VTLPEIELDDRRFQDLVSEARTRIATLCPEWTEHNVSDPGITLIELFAWMTDLMLYRLNRVPEKIHVQLLSLLGIRLRPATPARADLRFLLAAPPHEPVAIVPEETEVGTVRTASEESIVFGLIEGRVVGPQPPVAYAVKRGEESRAVSVEDGTARPLGDERAAFASVPQKGDALHLGFAEPIDRLVMQIEVEAEPARGAGVDPSNPPLSWHVSTGEDEDDWLEATVLRDTTGGFNFGSGVVVVELPARSAIASIGGERAHWLRCSVAEGGVYQYPPEISSITAKPVGAVLPAEHASRIEDELLGISDGTPGQTFHVRHAPMLAPRPDEYLEVCNPHTGTWEAWELRESFLDCGPEDRVWICDPAAGRIELGPSIRDGDGSWRRLGATPPKGAELRLVSYRHGGGLRGNVSAGTLTVLKSGPPGVASVTNAKAARGGVDSEPLEAVRQRAALELRGRHRAVTAEDFEHLALEATPRVARAVCVPPDEGNTTAVYVLPAIHPADRPLSFDELKPEQHVLDEITAYLDERRLLGTNVHVAPVRLKGVSVVAELQTYPLADVERIRSEAEHALYRYLNPLVGGRLEGLGTGWDFGRLLNIGELYGLLYAIDGVEYVRLLRLYDINLQTGEQAGQSAGNHVVLEPDQVIASGRHVVRATARGA
jgi:predicted phage baseplate assembly protein